MSCTLVFLLIVLSLYWYIPFENLHCTECNPTRIPTRMAGILHILLIIHKLILHPGIHLLEAIFLIFFYLVYFFYSTLQGAQGSIHYSSTLAQHHSAWFMAERGFKSGYPRTQSTTLTTTPSCLWSDWVGWQRKWRRRRMCNGAYVASKNRKQQYSYEKRGRRPDS